MLHAIKCFIRSEVTQIFYQVVIPLTVQLEFKVSDGVSDVWCVVLSVYTTNQTSHSKTFLARRKIETCMFGHNII